MFRWHDESIAALRQHWANGLSGSEIGAKLGTSRQSVLSKVRKLDLPRRMDGTSKRTLQRRRAAAGEIVERDKTGRRRFSRIVVDPKSASQKALDNARITRRLREEAAAAPSINPADILPESRMLTLDDRRWSGHCKWPYGDPQTAEYRYCAADCDATASYCPTHHKLAYRPAPERTPKPILAAKRQMQPGASYQGWG